MSRGRNRVHFSQTARLQAAAIAAWWIANRESAPGLFAAELEATVALLGSMPSVGQVYARTPRKTHRRLLIGRSGYHVYWRFDEASRTVTSTSVWHSARGRGPRL